MTMAKTPRNSDTYVPEANDDSDRVLFTVTVQQEVGVVREGSGNTPAIEVAFSLAGRHFAETATSEQGEWQFAIQPTGEEKPIILSVSH